MRQPLGNVRYWRSDDLDGLETNRVLRSAHTFPKHTHDQYAVGLMEEGANYCHGRSRRSSVVVGGQICLFNPGEVHSGEPERGVPATYRMFYADPHWLHRVAVELGGRDAGPPDFRRLIVPDADVLRAFLRLSDLVADGAELLARQSAMVGAYSLVLARHGGVRPETVTTRDGNAAVRRVRGYLAERLAHKVSLENLAEATGLSRFHMLRVFRDATGMTPHAYHTQLRVDRAKLLLRRGWAMADAAQETGFVDQSHFANTFRRYVGATPGQYLSR